MFKNRSKGREASMKEYLKNHKYIPYLILVLIFIVSLYIGFQIRNHRNQNDESLKGFLVLEDNRIAQKISYQENFVLVSCNSSQKNCSDLVDLVKESEITNETQVVFLDVYKYIENIQSADNENKLDYINEYNKLISKYSLTKLPIIQMYKEGLLKNSLDEIYSDEYANMNDDNQANELNKIKQNIIDWYEENK